MGGGCTLAHLEFSTLAPLTLVTYLNVHGVWFPVDALGWLSSLTCLRGLSIHSTPEVVPVLRSLTGLQRLALCEFGDAELCALESLSALTRLALSPKFDWVTGGGTLHMLSSLTRLQKLFLLGLYIQGDRAVLPCLSSLKYLRVLKTLASLTAERDFAALTDLRSLAKLDVLLSSDDYNPRSAILRLSSLRSAAYHLSRLSTNSLRQI